MAKKSPNIEQIDVNNLPDFNLVKEPWIKVFDKDHQSREVSLKEALCNAENIQMLSGESPAQDFAMLRFLLSVLYASSVFRGPFNDVWEVLERWKNVWDAGKFPDECVNYLDKNRDRFNLFDKDRPFMQIPYTDESANGILSLGNIHKYIVRNEDGQIRANAELKSYCDASKLNSRMLESSNKPCKKDLVFGSDRDTVSYSEAARSLLTLIAFDDNSLKPYCVLRRKDRQSCLGYAGTLSPIYAEGRNLFETLMLNLVLLKDGQLDNGALWPDQKPVWEDDVNNHIAESVVAKADKADNPATLCSWLSRRVMLVPYNDKVIGFIRYVGDVIPESSVQDVEQWTLWSRQEKARSAIIKPRCAPLPAQMWRELSSIVSSAESKKGDEPGVVKWVRTLSEDLTWDDMELDPPQVKLSDLSFRFHYTKAEYDAKRCSVTNLYDDSITFGAGLFTELGLAYVEVLQKELVNYEKAAGCIRFCMKEIAYIAGMDSFDKRSPEPECVKKAVDRFYSSINRPIRTYLLVINENEDKKDKAIETLNRIVYKAAVKAIDDTVREFSPSIYTRRKGKSEISSYTQKRKMSVELSSTVIDSTLKAESKLRGILVPFKKKGDENSSQ